MVNKYFSVLLMIHLWRGPRKMIKRMSQWGCWGCMDGKRCIQEQLSDNFNSGIFHSWEGHVPGILHLRWAWRGQGEPWSELEMIVLITATSTDRRVISTLLSFRFLVSHKLFKPPPMEYHLMESTPCPHGGWGGGVPSATVVVRMD